MSRSRRMFLAAAAILASSFAQTPSGWIPPETAGGQPDLSGIWGNVTLTPLQRPAELANKPFFTQQEAEAYEKKVLAQRQLHPSIFGEVWGQDAKVVSTLRTSLLVDPPDGKLPRSTQDAVRRAGQMRAARRGHLTDGPENRALQERCILWPPAGPPMLPGYNKYQIVQSDDYVMIVSEMFHDARIIPLDGRPHLPADVRQWAGDSRGHWEGNTLVVDTTNFTDKTTLEGSGKDMHLTERFTRTAPDTILYRFTVDDPASFVSPWTVEAPLHPAAGPLEEYACQENNQDLLHLLSGARADEKKAAESPK